MLAEKQSFPVHLANAFSLLPCWPINVFVQFQHLSAVRFLATIVPEGTPVSF